MASSNRIKQLSRQRLCQILEAGLPLKFDDYHNDQLIMRSMHEGVDGLLLPMIELASELDLSEEVRDYYRLRLREKQAGFLRVRHVCAQLLEALNDADIAVICMRGLAVAENLYGSKAHLRPQSDIDLLFQGRQLLDAKQVLWDLGFRPDAAYHNNFVRGDMTLDLHTEPLGIERIQAWKYLTPLRAEHFFQSAQHSELAGVQALQVGLQVELPYLCFHAMKHSFERLLWLYDIALFVKHVNKRNDWDEFLQGALKYKLQRPCYYALSYVQKHLGASVPENVLDQLRPNMNFFERGLFKRFMQHEIIPFLAERLFSLMQPDMAHRIRFWQETIYPSYEVREQMANGGCVKCSFIRKRMRQLLQACKWLSYELISLLRFK
ncbi:MAG: nucleotidyltransferase family protein [Mariprofundaceae bacterium]